MKRNRATRYLTYLLTCWQQRDPATGAVTWRFRLETPRSGEQRLFSSFEKMASTIQKELKISPQREEEGSEK